MITEETLFFITRLAFYAIVLYFILSQDDDIEL